jgi:hypothetical protein
LYKMQTKGEHQDPLIPKREKITKAEKRRRQAQRAKEAEAA